MPRTPIDYDEDDSDQDGESTSGQWKRRLVTWTLAALGLGLGFLIPYMLYLNHEVSERFGRLQWQVPTRVYARPLELRPGLAMDAGTLKTELDAAGYHEGDGSRVGSYKRDGGRWRISSRGFNDVDGAVRARRLEVSLSGGRVANVREAGQKQALKAARLDPARIASLYGQKQEERRLVRIEEVPELLVTGLQAVEDRDFNSHIGIDFTGMIRAAFKSATGRRQGASTLTQQLARSGLLGIGKEQTLRRKGKEILYALIIDARYEKRDILEAYLNQVYMGQRGSQAIHGVAAASEFYFGRDLADLKPEQIALLVGIVKGPSAYDPRRNPEAARARRDFALGEFHETQLIDDAQYQTALKAPLGVTKEAGTLAPNRFPAYIDLVRRQLARDYPSDELISAGLSVMTAMSPSAQALAEGAVTRTLKSLDSKRRPPLQTGLVLTDVHNGEVLAVVGSRHHTEHGFNRAVEAQRPVGSLLKPFVYMLALATPERFSLASYVDDSPVSVDLGRGKRWNPGNSDGRSHGTVRLIDALAMSYNQATVRVGMQVAPERIADLIHTLAGIQAEPRPSLILGAVDQSPYAMAQLYQFLASGGEIQPLHAVRGVLGANGRALKRYDTAPAPAQEGDAIAARLITLAGQHTVTSGTASPLMRDGLGRLNSAGKTGTSNDGRDSWYAGWTGDHLAVVWVGNDQNKETGLYGATGAMRVWSSIFARLPSAPLKVGDEGIDWQWVINTHSTDASCGGARRFAFVKGFAPAYGPCPVAEPVEGEEERRSWRDWFGLGDDDDDDDAQAPPPPPPPEP
ncbi:penicillin-binding protein 1B [Agrilutibacter solisilvae]|uniref:Penicillin-binding protein 1B n=1 Tax=Agrilutibacter solisilvae TaxID=2763317 RepID=A0A974Y142_9GAMM|nr:penicillin-binding protein 1B [Lysobacter solisilvae]QSX78495.1 penicillin-binding protein 1B [Lysobacter solisilvae]